MSYQEDGMLHRHRTTHNMQYSFGNNVNYKSYNAEYNVADPIVARGMGSCVWNYSLMWKEFASPLLFIFIIVTMGASALVFALTRVGGSISVDPTYALHFGALQYDLVLDGGFWRILGCIFVHRDLGILFWEVGWLILSVWCLLVSWTWLCEDKKVLAHRRSSFLVWALCSVIATHVVVLVVWNGLIQDCASRRRVALGMASLGSAVNGLVATAFLLILLGDNTLLKKIFHTGSTSCGIYLFVCWMVLVRATAGFGNSLVHMLSNEGLLPFGMFLSICIMSGVCYKLHSILYKAIYYVSDPKDAFVYGSVEAQQSFYVWVAAAASTVYFLATLLVHVATDRDPAMHVFGTLCGAGLGYVMILRQGRTELLPTTGSSFSIMSLASGGVGGDMTGNTPGGGSAGLDGGQYGSTTKGGGMWRMLKQHRTQVCYGVMIGILVFQVARGSLTVGKGGDVGTVVIGSLSCAESMANKPNVLANALGIAREWTLNHEQGVQGRIGGGDKLLRMVIPFLSHNDGIVVTQAAGLLLSAGIEKVQVTLNASNKALRKIMSLLADPSPQVSESAAGAVYFLARNANNRVPIAESEHATEGILNVLQHGTTPSLRYMTAALKDLSADEVAGKMIALHREVLERIVGLMGHTDSDIVECAVGTVFNLCIEDENEERIVGIPQTIPILARVLRTQTSDAIIERAAGTLLNLVVNEGSRKAVGKNVEVIHALVQLLNGDYSENTNLLRKVVVALALLTKDRVALMHISSTDGAMDALRSMMKHDNEKIVSGASAAVERIRKQRGMI